MQKISLFLPGVSVYPDERFGIVTSAFATMGTQNGTNYNTSHKLFKSM